MLSPLHYKVLVVEDNPDLAANLVDYLSAHDCVVDVSSDGLAALHLATTQSFDVILLDLMLPGLDGLSLCRHLRQTVGQTTPILMLTARDTLDDKVAGLEAGADDYLVKPFAFSELLARVRNILRRAPARQTETLQFADLEMDLLRHKAMRAGKQIDLAPQEYRLLEYLLRHPGEVLTRTRLAEQVWDMHFDGDSNVVDVAIRRLRRKADDPYPQKLIHTLRGVGYVLEERD